MSLGAASSDKARGLPTRLAATLAQTGSRIAAHFRERDPTLASAFGPALAVSTLLFVRSPLSNYIFDEQEALLANPFVNGKVPFRDVLTRDFWGLPHDRSIGSYRPLPNIVWRAFWQLGEMFHHPWALHWVNIVVHALNAACVARIAFGVTRDRTTSWLAGAAFATCAVLTEAVTGVVGIADVFGALGLLLAVLALEQSLPAMPVLVFLSVSLGFFSKESTLVALPILFWVALLAAPLHHPERPLRGVRAVAALAAATLSLVLYTETRRRFFPSDLPPELAAPLPPSSPVVERAFHAFLRWFSQPKLPQDPINNPLAIADTAHRVSGALGVYASGTFRALVPTILSGDYSFAAEPIPAKIVSLRSALGGALLVLPPVAGVSLFVATLASRDRESHRTRLFTLLAIGLVWVPVAYFPHSNIPVVLPTVRAERFWYLPAAGLSLLLGPPLAFLVRRTELLGVKHAGPALAALFLVFQATRARLHALDYTDDLVFWRATARAVPMSAKAHLNYGVMLGARSQLEGRLYENRRAMEIAPSWPMAHIYYADTLCRLGRADEAWPYYRDGMTMAPNDRNLIALALQCLWDHHAVKPREKELLSMADAKPGTWLAFLNRDIVWNGEKNNGVERKYRPRGYDEGPSE
ncbi:MAG TPA: tetratricopeptide repeat protein [Polyangiaceae bacterium]|nr:tetratricopeptide repeat protein [Polyangiaceae bacterium]